MVFRQLPTGGDSMKKAEVGKLSLKRKRTLAIAIALSLCCGCASAAEANGFKTSEYFASYGLDILDAASAYAKGYSGKGITLGVCDQPTNFLHPEFTSKNFAQMIKDSWMYGGKPGVYDWSTIEHGTHVAGIMAASRDGVGMHGVSYNANLAGTSVWYNFGGVIGQFKDPFEPFYQRDDIKVINNSWGQPVYFDELLNNDMEKLLETSESLDDFTPKFLSYLSNVDKYLSPGLMAKGTAAGNGKLLIFSAANAGHPTPALEAFSGWFYDAAQTNLINVTALNNNSNGYTNGMSRHSDGTLSGDWLMACFSDGAKYAEDYTLASPGHQIVSANANFAASGENYIPLSGTSMASPFVAGAAGLVEEAFPYMSSKQIADTLLSTANNKIEVNKDYFVTLQQDNAAGGAKIFKYNVFYFDGRKRSTEEVSADIEKNIRTSGMTEMESVEVLEYIRQYGVPAVYYDVPLQAFIGQGVVDVGKAVGGPGALNARRLEPSDVTSAYSADGSRTVMYPIDTKGYDSVWSNDIKEIKVGKISADSAEADLAERYNYYDTNWISNQDAKKGARLLTLLYMNAYNSNVENSGMEGLHVGLIKSGEGRLSLTGNNTYEGASVAKGGILSIDGSVAGDAYSVDSGIIAGRGAIGGTLYNRNVAVAGDSTGSGNLTMKNLVSTGTLLSHVTANGNSRFVVQDTADVAGSKVILSNALPNESHEVLTAGTLRGDVANTAEHPLATTGMLSTYGTVSGNTLTATAVAANNLGNMDSQQMDTYHAMGAMYRNLDATRREEMRNLYNLPAEGAKAALSQIGSSPAPDITSLAQQSAIVSQVIGDRLNTAFATAAVDVPVTVNHFADEPEKDKKNTMTIPVDLPMATDNNAWVKFTKHWGDMRSGANYHGQAISGGYDHAIGQNWRVGTFVSYNAMGYGAESANGNVYDTRFGFYGGYHKGARDAYIYLDYGWQKNKLRRGLMGMTASADYGSHLIELGGEYKYDLHADDGKIWHVSPYAGLQLSYLHHNGYNETGAGIFNQQVAGENNTYFAMQTGVEFKRYLNRGSYGMRLGVKHAFSGADPNLSFHYEGDAQNRYTLKNSQDKTHFMLSLFADAEFAPGWQIAGDAMLQKGSHDKDFSASIMLRRMW